MRAGSRLKRRTRIEPLDKKQAGRLSGSVKAEDLLSRLSVSSITIVLRGASEFLRNQGGMITACNGV